MSVNINQPKASTWLFGSKSNPKEFVFYFSSQQDWGKFF